MTHDHDTDPEATPIQEEPPVTTTPLTPDDLVAIRDLALRAYPETIPELVEGEDLAAILRSVERAGAAYQRIAQAAAERAAVPPSAPVAPTVPAGSAPPVAIDPEQLPPVEKIRRALASRR
jgi:hypothetical protein